MFLPCRRRTKLGNSEKMSSLKFPAILLAAITPLLPLSAQQSPPAAPPQPDVQLQMPSGPAQAPVTITLADAIARARKVDAQYLGSVGDARNSHEDTLQSRNAMLPQVSATSQFLGTEGYGTGPNKPTIGRFVTQDGVHVYRAWGVFKEDLSPDTYLATGLHHAQAAEALANAKAEIARRGLTVTVTKAYYSLAAAQRKYAAAQDDLAQAQNFLKITRDAENAGQAAHADVLKAQIESEQQQQAFDEAQLAMENARLDLAVLLFPTLNENFTVVDDLDTAAPLPAFAEMQDMAGKQNPDLRVATETLHEADVDVAAAKGAFLPSFNVETDYGIEANHFALRSVNVEFPEDGPLPNLGYFLTAGVTIPVFDWGTLRSKLHQSEITQAQARAELSQTQREELAGLYSAYNEATVAREGLASTKQAADDAAESLRLTELRYQAGESPALEVVDAQTTLTQSRIAYDDAQVRYRVALATLQTLTGPF
jgi:outer membrane protein TolC